MLQQAIGKSSGGSADIETYLALDIDSPVFERAFKFKSATADIFQIFAEQPDCRVNRDLRASLSTFWSFTRTFPARMRA